MAAPFFYGGLKIFQYMLHILLIDGFGENPVIAPSQGFF